MQSGSGLGNLLILVLPLLLLGFLFMTQRRRARETQQLQSTLAVGDEVVTTAGLYGTVVALEDTVAVLEVAPGVHLRFDRRAVGMKAPRTDEPTPGPADPDRPGTPGEGA